MDSTTILSYAVIYFLWGGAYLAMRCLAQEFPPLWVAGTRYALATICLVVLLAFRGLPLPTLRQFINAAWTGVVLLAIAYGSLFWAANSARLAPANSLLRVCLFSNHCWQWDSWC